MKKIVISSSWVGPAPNWVDLATLNHSQYAFKHNYTYQHHHHDWQVGAFNSDKPSDLYIKSVWQQIVDVRKLMDDHENSWIFKTDMDSVFTNLRIKISKFTRFNSDFLFTGDSNDVFNGGHFLIRNNDWSRDFIDLWLSYKDQIWENFNTSHQSESGKLSDQPVLNMILKEYKNLDISNGLKTFNSVNGFSGNPDRKIKHFWFTHAPTARYRIHNAHKILNDEIRSHSKIFLQSTFNSYPNRSPGHRKWRKGDFMIHFVGATKSQMEDFMNNPKNLLH